jgi:hypothetical protein
MKIKLLTPVLAVMVAGLIVLSGCGAPAPQNPAGPRNTDGTPTPAQLMRADLATPEKINVEVGPDEPQIFMLEPQDGVIINSPFYLRIGTANLKVPLLSAIAHISINAPCLAAGETFTEDELHFSLPVGKWSEPRFTLPAGKYRLCIQVSDSQNVILEGPGLTRIIDVEVLPSPPASND